MALPPKSLVPEAYCIRVCLTSVMSESLRPGNHM